MYKALRLRLTLWYVILSAFTFIAIGVVGSGLCYNSVTDAIDDSIKSMTYHSLSIVDEADPANLKFKQPPETIRTELAFCHATLQLFGKNGNLVGEYGPQGFPLLAKTVESEASYKGRRLRIGFTPIRLNDDVIGFLQVQEPTDARDKAVLTFALAMAWLTPLLVLTLGVSGYFFSEKASKPVEEAFTMLRQFLGDAGHELRTPVHLIQLTAENAMIGHEEDSELQHDLNTIVRATDRMGRLVEDMMMLAKMEVKQVTSKSIPVRLDELLSDAVSEYVLPAREKGIELSPGTNFAQTTVIGDPDQIYRVIANLIENSLRYTDAGGRVVIGLKQSGTSAKFFVEDTGIGIPPESLPKIFERFYRVDKSRTRAAGGTGLGLSIVKAICEMHNGDIVVESEEGVGSRFTVSLPLKVTGAQTLRQTSVNLLRQSGLHIAKTTSPRLSGPRPLSTSGSNAGPDSARISTDDVRERHGSFSASGSTAGGTAVDAVPANSGPSHSSAATEREEAQGEVAAECANEAGVSPAAASVTPSKLENSNSLKICGAQSLKQEEQ